MCLLVVIIVFGNSLILACVRKIDEMKSVTGIFLANLAISDLGVGVICLPIAIAASIDETLLGKRFVCNMDGFSLVLFFIGAILTLCAISIQKYIAVVYAMRFIVTRKHAMMMVASVWVISMALAAGPLFGWSRYVYQPGRHQCSTPVPKDKATLSHMGMLLGFGYIIPLATMLFCYGRLYCTTRKHLRRLQKTAIAESVSVTEADLINTLVLVLLAFILCWLPFVVYISYGITQKPVPYYLPTVAFLFGYGNSALNPVIYALRHHSFRKAFKELVSCASQDVTQNRTLLSVVCANSPKAIAKRNEDMEQNKEAFAMDPLIKG